MKVTINIEKRYAYVIIGLLVFAIGIMGVNAAVDKNLAWHNANQIEITDAFCTQVTGHACGTDNTGGEDLSNLPAGKTISSLGRLHISGEELLYLLNKNGVIIGKEWGGNGNLQVQGDLTVNGNLKAKGTISGAGADMYLYSTQTGYCSVSFGQATCVTNGKVKTLTCPSGSSKIYTGKSDPDYKHYLCVTN